MLSSSNPAAAAAAELSALFTNPVKTARDKQRHPEFQRSTSGTSVTESANDLALRKIIKLEKAFTTPNLGLQLQAISLFNQLFDDHPFPIVINTGFLKLADLYRASNNTIRYFVFKVFEKSGPHLSKLLTVDETVKRVVQVMASNEPVGRAITLRTLGCMAVILAERVDIHHIIIKTLNSDALNELELEAALYAADRFCARSERFAQELLESCLVEEMAAAPTTPLVVKKKIVDIFRHMHGSVHVARKARCICLNLLNDRPTEEFLVTILRSLTDLATRALADSKAQIDLLIDIAEKDDRVAVKLEAVRNLLLLVPDCGTDFDGKHLKKLFGIFIGTNSTESLAFASKATQQLQEALLELFTDLFSPRLGYRLFQEATAIDISPRPTPFTKKTLEEDDMDLDTPEFSPSIGPTGRRSPFLHVVEICEELIGFGRAGVRSMLSSNAPEVLNRDLATSTFGLPKKNFSLNRRIAMGLSVRSARLLVGLVVIWKSASVQNACRSGKMDGLCLYLDNLPSRLATLILETLRNALPYIERRTVPAQPKTGNEKELRNLLDCLIAIAGVIKCDATGQRDTKANCLVGRICGELLEICACHAVCSVPCQSLILKCLGRIVNIYPLCLISDNDGALETQKNGQYLSLKCAQLIEKRLRSPSESSDECFTLALRLVFRSHPPHMLDFNVPDSGSPFMTQVKSYMSQFASSLDVSRWHFYLISKEAAMNGWWEFVRWIIDEQIGKSVQSEETNLWLSSLAHFSYAERDISGVANRGMSAVSGNASPLEGIGKEQVVLGIGRGSERILKALNDIKALSSIAVTSGSGGGSWMFQRWFLQLRLEFLDISRVTLSQLSFLLRRPTCKAWRAIRKCAERYRALSKRYSYFIHSFFGVDEESLGQVESLQICALVLSFAMRLLLRIEMGKGYFLHMDPELVPFLPHLDSNGEHPVQDLPRGRNGGTGIRRESEEPSPIWNCSIQFLRYVYGFLQKLESSGANWKGGDGCGDGSDMDVDVETDGREQAIGRMKEFIPRLADAICQTLRVPLQVPKAYFDQGLAPLQIELSTSPQWKGNLPLRVSREEQFIVNVEGVIGDAFDERTRKPLSKIRWIEVIHYVSSAKEIRRDAESLDDKWTLDVRNFTNGGEGEEGEAGDGGKARAWRSEARTTRVRITDGYFSSSCLFEFPWESLQQNGRGECMAWVNLRCRVVDSERGEGWSVEPEKSLGVLLV